MFRFWSSDARGCDKTVEAIQHMPGFTKSLQHAGEISPANGRALKRKRQRPADVAGALVPAPARKVASPTKRVKTESHGGDALRVPAAAADSGACAAAPPPPAGAKVTKADDVDRVKDVIQQQFGLEILLKHNELRLIEQELAKCQTALEQLRRCHLIPYPTSCPTPQQMMDISSGKGAAVRPRPGDLVPKWAPPFGVVDGPYARHYAKWLIPDPKFDGLLPPWQGIPLAAPTKAAVEGRTTRNSFVETGFYGKHRPVRGVSGQKLHSLSSGYPQPKEKAGPCVLKRSDGQTVKLVCIDCNRENFSSTQGFINHCRIAHKRDFKSHEEAAVHCGHPIEADEASPATTSAPEDRPSGASAPPPPASSSLGLVHPLARPDRETCDTVLSRIEASLKMYDQGRLPGVDAIPSAAVKAELPFSGSDKTPYLSRLMLDKKLGGNLRELVDDAKTRVDLDELLSPDDDSEDGEPGEGVPSPATDAWGAAAGGVRTPAVMRMPARPTMAPAPLVGNTRPTSSKGRSPRLSFSIPSAGTGSQMDGEESPGIYEDDEMDADLSPNTTASNNAPSLVSDDGEYDDSEDGSSSEVSDSEAESVSDVAEVSIAEDEVQGHESPRGLRHHRGSTVKKDESKHVTFVSPVRNNSKGRRKQNI